MHFLCYPPPKFKKMFWAHFLDFWVQKRSCLQWSPDAFWRFSPCNLTKKSSERIFKIFASRNEGISREVQTHFVISLPASFTEKVLGAISRFVYPKMKLFAVKFRRIFEVLCLARFMNNVDAFSRFFHPRAKLFAVEFRCILEVFSMQVL